MPAYREGIYFISLSAQAEKFIMIADHYFTSEGYFTSQSSFSAASLGEAKLHYPLKITTICIRKTAEMSRKSDSKALQIDRFCAMIFNNLIVKRGVFHDEDEKNYILTCHTGHCGRHADRLRKLPVEKRNIG